MVGKGSDSVAFAKIKSNGNLIEWEFFCRWKDKKRNERLIEKEDGYGMVEKEGCGIHKWPN